MAAQYIFTMKDLGKVVPPKREILKGIYLSFYPGAKIGVLGQNGSGKSSLLRIMAGEDKDFLGEARAADGIKIGYLPQEPRLNDEDTVLQSVSRGVKEQKDLLARFEELNLKLAEPLSEQQMDKLLGELSKVQDAIEAQNVWELDRTLDIAMDALRLPPQDAKIGLLSGGEKRRVALCQLLLSSPDMLLLDEPTNHLDAESVSWLENYLAQFKGTVVAVTHDRYFLDNVAGWILELDRGQGIPYEGNYSSWLEQKQKRLAVEEKQESARQRTLQRELEWVRSSPKARQAKSKARLKAYDELLQQTSESRVQMAEITIPAPPRLGDDVVVATSVSKSYGDKLLIDKLSFRLPRGGIVGVIGPNGAGKTTLFRMIASEQTPDSGQLKLGETVRVSYGSQFREDLSSENTVWKEISEGQDYFESGKQRISSRAFCSQFGFRGSDQQKLVKELSGGERNRLHLAKTLRNVGNLLLLDEPTNDLDVDTLRALEDALLDFPGCAVVISHDRWFLDRIATHMIAFEGNGRVVWFEGNYQDYEADYKKRMGQDALDPQKTRFKKLTHHS